MINNINNAQDYIKTSVGMPQSAVQQNIQKSTKAVKDNIESNSVIKTVSTTSKDDTKYKTLSVLPIVYLVNQSIEKMMAGDGNKSILKKLANAGDKLSNIFHIETFFDFARNKTKSARNFIKNNTLTKYFTNDYKAVAKINMGSSSSSLKEYTSEILSILPELKFDPSFRDKLGAKTVKFLENEGGVKVIIDQQYLSDVLSALKDISSKNLPKAESELIKGLNDKISTILQDQDVLGRLNTKNISEEISTVFSLIKDNGNCNISSLNKNTQNIFSTIADKTSTIMESSVDDIIDVVDDVLASGIDKIQKGGLNNSKNVRLSLLNNKLKAVTSKIANSTLGNILPKSLLKSKDFLTFGGGLFSLYFTASALVNAGKAAKEAPKGEKKSTFMHVLSEQYLGLLLFNPSIKLLYNIGGNKYRGMTVEARTALKNLVASTNSNPSITREGLKIAKIQKKLLLKGVDKDQVAQLSGKGLKEVKSLAKTLKKQGTKIKLWEKPLKLMGKILSSGLDDIRKNRYIKIPKINKSVKLPTIKGFLAGFGRFAIIMFVLQPLLQKPLTKLCHKVFGEPTTYLKKQENSSKNEAKTTNPLNEQNNELNMNPSTNLIAQYTNRPITQTQVQKEQLIVSNNNQNSGIQPQVNMNTNINPYSQESAVKTGDNQQNTSENNIAALNLFKKDKEKISYDGYIPSIEVNHSDNNEEELNVYADKLIQNSDSVIKSAKKYI